MMFGLRNRNKYNGSVDAKLGSEYGIQTRDNPSFPGPLAYLNLIDTFYSAHSTEDECALQIAILYLCGLYQHGFFDDAESLAKRIDHKARVGIQQGLIRDDVWRRCLDSVDKVIYAPSAAAVDAPPHASGVTGPDWASISARIAERLWQMAAAAPTMLLNPFARVILGKDFDVLIGVDDPGLDANSHTNGISYVLLHENPDAFAGWVAAITTFPSPETQWAMTEKYANEIAASLEADIRTN